MKIFGGFISATYIHGIYTPQVGTHTLPIAMYARDEGEAEVKARNSARSRFPVDGGYANHAWGVVELTESHKPQEIEP